MAASTTRVPTWLGMVIIVLLLLTMATVMIPDLGPEAYQAWEDSGRPALEEWVADPVCLTPASGFGDPCYDWHRLAGPGYQDAGSATLSLRVEQRSDLSAGLR